MHAESRYEELDPHASAEALPFVLADEPSHTTDRAATQVLEVVQVFGDSILAVRHLRPGEDLVLGRDLDVAPEFVTGVPIARHEGAWVVECDRPARLKRRIGSREVEGEVRLGDDDQLVLQVGAVTLVFREVWRSRRLPVPLTRDVDVPFVVLAGLVGAMTALVGWIGGMLPEPDRSVARNDDVTHIVKVFQQRPTPPPPPQHASGGTREAAPSGGGRPAPRNRVEHPDAGGARRPAGILAALDDSALSSILGNSALPSDITTGIGRMHGATTGELGGVGLGGRCVGPDCLGVGDGHGDGVGPVATRGRGDSYGDPGSGSGGRKPPGVISDAGGPILIGNLDRADIDKVVKKHLSKIRYCYQRELQKRPDLAGKVKVKFVIAGDGTVSTATTATTTLGEPAAETCINHVFTQMVFPQPKGGGVAIVSYPFLFAPG